MTQSAKNIIEYAPLSRRIELQQRTARHYADMAESTRMLKLLREVRAALPADYFELAGRIDDVIHGRIDQELAAWS